MTYSDFQGEIINPALHALMRNEFNTSGSSILDTRFYPDFELEYLAKRGEYIRWFANDSEFISGLSNGETRQYNYTITYYIDNAHQYVKKFFETMVTDRLERLTKLLVQNRTYEVSGAYKWHDCLVQNRSRLTRLNEVVEEAKDSIMFVEMQVSIMRTNTW